MTTVLSELDDLKAQGRTPEVRASAQEVARRLKGLRTKGSLHQGISVKDLANAVEAAVLPATALGVEDCPKLGELVRTGQLQRDWSVRRAWACDLFDVRNSFAHGRASPQAAGHWTVEEHLLLASFLVPRIVKLLLADHGCYSLTDSDAADIDVFELLACEDLFADPGRDPEEVPRLWAWNRVLLEHREAKWHESLTRRFQSLLDDSDADADATG